LLIPKCFRKNIHAVRVFFSDFSGFLPYYPQSPAERNDMAGGTLAPVGSAPLHVDQYHAKLTWYVFVVALVAASGGLLFGYDIGITGESYFS
jgi:hypothetical protein